MSNPANNLVGVKMTYKMEGKVSHEFCGFYDVNDEDKVHRANVTPEDEDKILPPGSYDYSGR